MVTIFMVIPNTVITNCHLLLLVDSYCPFILNIMVNETLEMSWFKLTTENVCYLILYKCYAKSFTDFIYTCAVLFFIA
jgi:hypothetical protein